MLEYVYKRVIEFIAPPFCFYCHTMLEDRPALCSYCKSLLRIVPSFQVSLTALMGMTVFAYAAYDEPLKTFILAKNSGNSFAAQQLGILMAENMPLPTIICDVLVPIPLHWTRYAQRGFNQAEVIARTLGSKLKKPVVTALKRVKRTRFQSAVQGHERFHNVQEAFKLGTGAQDLMGKHVVLIDDLVTTGATLAAAGKVLIEAGVCSLTALVACKAL